MKIHPLADLFPSLEGPAFDEFCEDIRKRGQIEPITVLGNIILDGRNRQRACDKLQRPVKRVQFDSLGLSITPEEFIWSKNVQRRHLTDDQRAAIAMEWRPQFIEAGKRAMAAGGGDKVSGKARAGLAISPNPVEPRVRTRWDLAKLAGVSETKMRRTERLASHPELLEEVKAGKLTVPEAVRQVKNDPPATKRKVIVENAAKKRMISVLSEIRGMCRGLTDINMIALHEVCTDEEKRTWANTAREAARNLKAFAVSLEQRVNGKHEAQVEAQDDSDRSEVASDSSVRATGFGPIETQTVN